MIPFVEKRIWSLHCVDGVLLALWRAKASELEGRPANKQDGTVIGVTMLVEKDGMIQVASEVLLPLRFGEPKDVTIGLSFLFQEKMIFEVEERYSEPSAWGTRSWVLAFTPKASRWEAAIERNEDGTLEFKVIDSLVEKQIERKVFKLVDSEIKLFLDKGVLKCGYDHTAYHLDDWVRNDDVSTFCSEPECAFDYGNRTEPKLNLQFPERGVQAGYIPLIARQRIMASISLTGEALAILNLKERLMQDIPNTCEPDDVIHEVKAKFAGRANTVPWDQKEGVQLVGKLSDIKLPPIPVEPPKVIPEVSVRGVVCRSNGSTFGAINVLATKKLNYLFIVVLPG